MRLQLRRTRQVYSVANQSCGIITPYEPVQLVDHVARFSPFRILSTGKRPDRTFSIYEVSSTTRFSRTYCWSELRNCFDFESPTKSFLSATPPMVEMHQRSIRSLLSASIALRSLPRESGHRGRERASRARRLLSDWEKWPLLGGRGLMCNHLDQGRVM